MPLRVKIVRNRVPFRSAVWRLNNLFAVLLKVFYLEPNRAAERARLDELRAQKIAKDMELAEMRRQKIANELVIQDLKIERMNSENGHPVPPEWTYHNDQHP